MNVKERAKTDCQYPHCSKWGALNNSLCPTHFKELNGRIRTLVTKYVHQDPDSNGAFQWRQFFGESGAIHITLYRVPPGSCPTLVRWVNEDFHPKYFRTYVGALPINPYIYIAIRSTTFYQLHKTYLYPYPGDSLSGRFKLAYIHEVDTLTNDVNGHEIAIDTRERE